MLLRYYHKTKDLFDFKNKKKLNGASMFFVTKLSKKVNELSEKYKEISAYLSTIKRWKAYTENELAIILKKEETKICEENSLLELEEAKLMYKFIYYQ